MMKGLDSIFVWIIQEIQTFGFSRTDPTKPIEVKGWIPYSSHKKANGQLDEVVTEILVNGNSVATYKSKEDKVFDIKISQDKVKDIIAKDQFYDLEIRVNSQFTPSKISNSKDERSLSEIISFIGEE